MTTVATTSAQSRALKLLGDGFSPEQVASAVGVTPSYISQLLSDDTFSQEVAQLRYKNLASQTERDLKYDELEDKLLKRLESSLGMLFDPMKIAKLLQIINGAKRRGVSSPEQITAQQTIVNLSMPTQIYQKFVTNINNQVIQAGEQNLITVQSSQMSKLLERASAQKLELNHVQTSLSAPSETSEPN